MLPKETSLLVEDENKVTSPILLPTTPKAARVDCHSPNVPVAISDKQNNFLVLAGSLEILIFLRSYTC